MEKSDYQEGTQADDEAIKGNCHWMKYSFVVFRRECLKMYDFNDVGTSLCDVKLERQQIDPTCQRHVPTFRLF